MGVIDSVNLIRLQPHIHTLNKKPCFPIVQLLSLLNQRPAKKSFGLTRAFTLIEVIAVLVVLSVLAAGIISIIPRSSAALATEVDRLASHLRYAQMRAQADNMPWALNISATGYTMEASTVDGVAIIPGEGAETRSFSPGVTGVPANLRFDSWGRSINASGVPVSVTLTLSEGGNSRSITVHADTGFIE